MEVEPYLPALFEKGSETSYFQMEVRSNIKAQTHTNYSVYKGVAASLLNSLLFIVKFDCLSHFFFFFKNDS